MYIWWNEIFSEFIYLFLVFLFYIFGEKSVVTVRSAAATPLLKHSEPWTAISYLFQLKVSVDSWVSELYWYIKLVFLISGSFQSILK